MVLEGHPHDRFQELVKYGGTLLYSVIQNDATSANANILYKINAKSLPLLTEPTHPSALPPPPLMWLISATSNTYTSHFLWNPWLTLEPGREIFPIGFLILPCSLS